MKINSFLQFKISKTLEIREKSKDCKKNEYERKQNLPKLKRLVLCVAPL